jgi:hypothetical protein
MTKEELEDRILLILRLEGRPLSRVEIEQRLPKEVCVFFKDVLWKMTVGSAPKLKGRLRGLETVWHYDRGSARTTLS